MAWDVATGRPLLGLPGQAFATGLAFSGDGRRLDGSSIHKFNEPFVGLWSWECGLGITTLRGLACPVARVTFLDRDRDPTEPPDPRYPDGIDLDMSDGARRACLVKLPHPAPRCGLWAVECTSCGFTAIVTCAGRRDDPKTLKMKCNLY